EVFLDFADAFSQQQGSPEIVAAGLSIFGRSFQNLIPLLKDGSQGLKDAGIEAEQLGLVLSTEAGQNAEKFNDDLTRLKSGLTGIWREVAEQVLPQLIVLSGEFVSAAKDGDTMKKAADGIAESLRAVADTASLFGDLLDALGKIREVMAYIERWQRAGPVGRIGDAVRASLPEWLYTPIGSGQLAGLSSTAPASSIKEFDPTLGAPLTPAEIAAQRRKLAEALGGGTNPPKPPG